MRSDFAVFILTNGRPDRVKTFDTLREQGYTGPIFLLVDDLDKTAPDYIARYGPDRVVVFDKKAIARTFDSADNFNDMRAIIYARNASFQVAEQLGVRYFLQLDDDYNRFEYRFDSSFRYVTDAVWGLDAVFGHLLQFYIDSGAHAVAMAQGGDFRGGSENPGTAQCVKVLRKCMNSFLCSVDRPFQFVGRINEDVNTYTHLASKGLLMLTTNQVSLVQTTTQSNPGGMTELYLDSGTYVKSFYTVMFQPSSVCIREMAGRLHHNVAWRYTVPKLLSETLRKAD